MSNKLPPLNECLTKEIRKAMIDADIGYDQIGHATGRAWRYRISNPGRMCQDDYTILCDRLHITQVELLTRANNRRRAQ